MAALSTRVHTGHPPAGLAALSARPEGSFFQTPAWLDAVVRAEPRFRIVTVLAEDDTGALRAACPFVAARRMGVRFLYAGAWGTYGGILAVDAEAAAAARAGVAALARDWRGALVRVHDFAATLATAGWREHDEICQVLDLPAEPDVLFRTAFTAQNRNKIRKAEKLGVTVRRADDSAALAAYAELYRESAARLHIAAPGRERLFAALAGVRGVDVWLAEKDGETIAGLLNFTHGGQVMNWGNVSRRDAWGVSPNNLLHWRALERACADAHGPRLYNFGASTGLPGVETFKASFGARAHRYARRERWARWAGWLPRR